VSHFVGDASLADDRARWQNQPLTGAFRGRMSTEAKEHNERTCVKYTSLVHERPDLFE
jgi:hypothetical protein